MTINDPASKPGFLTGTQQIVVESRVTAGYDWQILPNGNYRIWKGRHTMEINCLGYDVYIRTGGARL